MASMATRSLLRPFTLLPPPSKSAFPSPSPIFRPSPSILRHYTTPPSAPSYLDANELHVFNLVKDSPLAPSKLEVQDISGGCGSMYALDIVSEKFKGLSVMKQHRLVNQVLEKEIKKWHGVQLKTKAP